MSGFEVFSGLWKYEVRSSPVPSKRKLKMFHVKHSAYPFEYLFSYIISEPVQRQLVLAYRMRLVPHQGKKLGFLPSLL